MFTHYRSQALILGKKDSGEADRLFTAYTKDFGRLELLAKAVRKIKSKLRVGLEIFYLSEIEFIQGKVQKTLTDAVLIDSFKNLRNDLARLSIASSISETFDKLVKGQEPDEKLWQLLTETFKKLNDLQLKAATCFLVYYYFFWNFLSLLGYQPQLYNCVLCQKKIVPEKNYFNLKEGGLICINCLKKVKLVKEIDAETIKILRVILDRDWITLSKLKVEEHHLKSLNLISKECYSYIRNNL